MFLILLWSLLRGEQAPGGMGVPPGADALSILKGLVGQFRDWVFRFRADWTLPALAAGFFCFLAPSAAQTSALLWHLVRRGSDDFGRDYYTFAVGGRARRAAWSGALLLPFAAVLLWVTPPFAAGKAGILPFGNLAPEIMTLLYNMLPLGLPLAVLCCYLPGRSASPLRRKSFALFGRRFSTSPCHVRLSAQREQRVAEARNIRVVNCGSILSVEIFFACSGGRYA